MAGRGGELWPSQGHCTEGIFIDRGPRRGDTCTDMYCSRSKFQSHSNCCCFLWRVVIKEGEVLQIGLVQILIVFSQWICKLEHVGF